MRALAVLLIREGRPARGDRSVRWGLRLAEQAEDEAEIARLRTVNFQARLAAGDERRPDELAPVEEYAVRHGERWYEGMLHYYRGVARSRRVTSSRRGAVPNVRSRRSRRAATSGAS